MALGNTNQNQSTRKLLILKLKGKDANDQPLVPNMFQVSEKGEDGKWVARAELQPRVSGNLTRVELGEGEYQKKKYGTVKLYLEDPAADELYLLDMRYNQLSRNLFNSLANLTSFSDLSISNYSTKSKTPGDDRTFANISLWQGKNMVKGKTEFSAIPQPELIKHPKTGEVISRDFTDVDNFFKPQLEELAMKVSVSNTKISD